MSEYEQLTKRIEEELDQLRRIVKRMDEDEVRSKFLVVKQDLKDVNRGELDVSAARHRDLLNWHTVLEEAIEFGWD